MQVNQVRSDLCNISCGVPHSSLFGWKLFIWSVNDLVNNLFEDDTTLFYYCENTEQMLEVIQTKIM